MSMPKIENQENPIERQQSVSDLVESVALMETGLSHIINAEGEKIQKVIKADDPTSDVPIEDIIKVNDSVNHMVNSVTKLEMMLQSKLETSKKLDNPVIIPESGTIIPYNGYVVVSSQPDGSPEIGGIISFAYIPLTTNIDLRNGIVNVEIPYNINAFSMPRDGTLTSISVFCSTTESGSVAPGTQVIARVYVAEPNSDMYNSIEEAVVYLTPKIESTAKQELTGYLEGLNIKLLAKQKITIIFYILADSYSTLYAICGGGLNIK